MKYDDASWHYGGDFPEGLPESAGAIHSGLFVAWAIQAGLGSEEVEGDAHLILERKVTPATFVMEHWDGKFGDSMLSDEGNAFASFYFEPEGRGFVVDYGEILVKDLPTYYHVPDTWESFDRIKSIIDTRYREWKSQSPAPPRFPAPSDSSPKKPWWKIW